jgi:hypothetical protein
VIGIDPNTSNKALEGYKIYSYLMGTSSRRSPSTNGAALSAVRRAQQLGKTRAADNGTRPGVHGGIRSIAPVGIHAPNSHS